MVWGRRGVATAPIDRTAYRATYPASAGMGYGRAHKHRPLVLGVSTMVRKAKGDDTTATATRTILDIAPVEGTARRSLVTPLYGVQQGEALLRAACGDDALGVTAAQYQLAYAAEGGAPWRKAFAPKTRAHYQSTHTARWHGAGFVHEMVHVADGADKVVCTIRHGGRDSDACAETSKNARDGARRWHARNVAVSASVTPDDRLATALGRTRHYIAAIAAAHDLTYSGVIVGPYFAPFVEAGLKGSTKAIRPAK